jgi:hypothetical protein
MRYQKATVMQRKHWSYQRDLGRLMAANPTMTSYEARKLLKEKNNEKLRKKRLAM